MRYHFIKESKSRSVILLFAGWGVDAQPFSHWDFPGYDLLVCYDYSTLEFDDSIIEKYHEVMLVGWSFGVWVASKCLENKEIKIAHSIAINGTIDAIDDLKGIPSDIFEGTLSRLSANTLEKFNLRMCGNREILSEYKSICPKRDVESLRSELSFIGKAFSSCGTIMFHWDEVIIGTKDLIFPTANQVRGWQDHHDVKMMDIAHYAEFSGLIKNYLTNS
ncbi:MAG: pimeloyl-ACP methyl esterase BioG family protein [Bacteroidales bacterium]